MRRTRFLRSFLVATSANFATLTALAAPIVIALSALAVDGGSLYVERREAQSVTDLAAIAAATSIGDAEAAARATFEANGMPFAGEGQVRAEPGRYTPDHGLPPDQRFSAGSTPANAVRVTYEKTGRLHFARAFFSPPRIATTALAGKRAAAAFSVGSRLARLDEGLLNALLGGLTGSQISLTAMDYDALLSSHVDLLGFFGDLASTLDVDAVTYDDLLAAQLTFSELAAALQGAEGMTSRARQAADHAAHRANRPSAPRFRLSSLLDPGAFGPTPLAARSGGFATSVSALQILMAAAALADGGGSQIQVDLGASVPGLLETTLELALGEPPQGSAWLAVGEGGEIVRTAQTRLRLVVQIGGPGGLLGASIRVPLYLDLAYAEAKLADIACPTGRPESLSVAVDARPGIADLRIADMDPARLADFRNPVPLAPAVIVSAPLVTVTGTAHAEIGNTDDVRLTFDANAIEKAAARQIATTDFTQSLFTSLLGDLDLKVKLGGVGLGLPAVLSQTVAATLSTAAPAIDTLLANLLSTLGVSVGEAVVRVHGATCGRPVLVQ